MYKDAKKVRKAIMQRKKQREIYPKNNGQSTKQIIPPFPQDEERHGYYPSFIDSSSSENKLKSQWITSFMLKGTLSVILFFGVGILWQTDAPILDTPKKWTSNALTEEFPFANVYKWYHESFGSPLAFSPNPANQNDEQALALPVIGNVTESFRANGTGIKIAPLEETQVTALQEGFVIFSGNDRNTDKTVIVQHADGSNTIYGNLSSIDVHLYQYIQANQRIGNFVPEENNETVYFAIERGNQFIDPVQVIEVDENP